MSTEKKWTTVILTKNQKVDLKKVLRKEGLLTFKELFDWVIEKSLNQKTTQKDELQDENLHRPSKG